MFGKNHNSLDGKTYRRSLRSKDSAQRFYDQLRSHNKQYEETRISRFLGKIERRRRQTVEKRTLKRIERRR